MLKFLLRLPLLMILLPGVGGSAAAESPDLPEPAILISNQNGTLALDISYRVPVSPREAWTVLTDFENMPAFIPNLESSKVLLRNGRTLQIEQKGSISLGMLPVHYESTRQIEVVPYQTIRSHTLSGDTRLDSVMALTPSGKGTLLSYRATVVPGLPVPDSLVSAYLGDMLEGQFKAMGREMLRRAQAGALADESLLPAQQPGQGTDPQLASLPAMKTAAKTPAKQSRPPLKKTLVQTKKRPG